MLRGLGDVGAHDPRAQLVLAALHEQQDDWDGVRTAYLRAGRDPAGVRSVQGSRLRRALTGLALAMRRMLLRDADHRADDQRRADEHTIWMLMTAAAAELGTLSGRGVVTLRPSAHYLTAEWAPEVLRLQDESAGSERPGWADGLAERAAGLQEQSSVGALRAFSDEHAEQAYLETPWGARVTLAAKFIPGVTPPTICVP